MAACCRTAFPYRHILAIVFLIAAAAFGNGQAGASPPGYDIIIVAGQSNAVGVGLGPFTDPLESELIDGKILQIGRVGPDNMRLIPVGNVVNGIKFDGLQHWGAHHGATANGFALFFARHYVREELAPSRSVVIIPAARGGTSILEWLGEGAPNHKASPPLPLYPDMIARVRAALALPGENRVVAFLWHQGEADANLSSIPSAQNATGMTPRVYEEDLSRLIKKIRKDIPGAYPIVMGTLTPDWIPRGPNGAEIKAQIEQAIRNVAAHEEMAGVASSAGLLSNYAAGASPSPVQKVHFSAAAAVELGRRYYETWKHIKEAQLVPQGTQPN
ncbi:MAG TPA: sialate O-acetylesterase [Methylocella sp.]|nr:sialate O-acetylesterase [Methylocella sp.]